MRIRKRVTFRNKPYDVILQSYDSLTSKGIETKLEVEIKHQNDTLYFTSLKANTTDEGFLVDTIVKVFHDYSKSDEYKLYEKLSKWNGKIEEGLQTVSNITINVTTSLKNQDEVSQLEKKLKDWFKSEKSTF